MERSIGKFLKNVKQLQNSQKIKMAEERIRKIIAIKKNQTPLPLTQTPSLSQTPSVTQTPSSSVSQGSVGQVNLQGRVLQDQPYLYIFVGCVVPPQSSPLINKGKQISFCIGSVHTDSIFVVLKVITLFNFFFFFFYHSKKIIKQQS
eukprot:TRINITY_DN4738_c2_g1_i1.p3 TRINITY_DN4738_c2_g1~~TRINITY_DN4738_c2_g1_i1.p3  ORF type:complete len:147 (+),score=8.02 TRINITY_DN4738_c2_g1_i1:81-521(+)